MEDKNEASPYLRDKDGTVGGHFLPVPLRMRILLEKLAYNHNITNYKEKITSLILIIKYNLHFSYNLQEVEKKSTKKKPDISLIKHKR